MAVEIRVPPLGESVVEATVGRWTKQEGESVRKDEVLVELETDKITIEVSAPKTGVLGRIAKQEGDTVGLDELLAELEEGEGTPAGLPAAGAAAAEASPAAEGRDDAEEREGGAEERAPGGDRDDAAEREAGAEERAPAAEAAPQTSPAARAIAAEHGLDLGQIRGTGPNGRITKEDVLKAAEAKQGPPTEPVREREPAPTPPEEMPVSRPEGRETRERMSRRRQTIARRLVEAQQTTASLTTFNEVDLTRVMELRKRRQDAFVERYGVKLGFMSFFTRAAIGALRQFPRVNGEIQGDEIVLKHYYDIGVAVGTDEGLVVPVVRAADQKSFAELEKEIGSLAKKARDGKLSLPELQGGTFTITNGGIYGSMLSTPILNPPQVGILGMHNIVQRPMVVDGEIRIRPMMYVALTYDHRMVDGSEAVRFLVAIKEQIEDPESMLFT
jgi:2-oxoglutarate dehydrogenase E2 component (dihydrolipoamide succinyltransferase)